MPKGDMEQAVLALEAVVKWTDRKREEGYHRPGRIINIVV